MFAIFKQQEEKDALMFAFNLIQSLARFMALKDFLQFSFLNFFHPQHPLGVKCHVYRFLSSNTDNSPTICSNI